MLKDLPQLGKCHGPPCSTAGAALKALWLVTLCTRKLPVLHLLDVSPESEPALCSAAQARAQGQSLIDHVFPTQLARKCQDCRQVSSLTGFGCDRCHTPEKASNFSTMATRKCKARKSLTPRAFFRQGPEGGTTTKSLNRLSVPLSPAKPP